MLYSKNMMNMLDKKNFKSLRDDLQDSIKGLKARSDALGVGSATSAAHTGDGSRSPGSDVTGGTSVLDEERGDSTTNSGRVKNAPGGQGPNQRLRRARPASGPASRPTSGPASGLATAHNISHQTNFLFIMFDDLRPELSIYGNTHNIDL